jgi:aryl-alcohol dehydrogenase-like predicted oxidoreductase
MPMQTRTLGKSGLRLTPIGLGTWAMGGGDWKFGWGPQDDKESIAAIHAALDAGVNWIDTAAIYGHGRSEQIVGEAIRGRRDSVLIATKCGRVWEGDSREIGKSLTRESILREVDASLRRLGIDVIDLYQIHWPEPDEQVEEGWATVADLVKAGKVRFAGVCNFNLSQLKRAQAIHPITSLQPPYSMLKREIEDEIVPWCRANGVGILAYSPMQAGLLTGAFTSARVASLSPQDWRSRHPLFTEPQLSVNLRFVDRLRTIATKMGISVSQLALAWVLRLPEITSAIAGARNASQIQETVRAGRISLPVTVAAEIDDLLQLRERELSATV